MISILHNDSRAHTFSAVDPVAPRTGKQRKCIFAYGIHMSRSPITKAPCNMCTKAQRGRREAQPNLWGITFKLSSGANMHLQHPQIL
jgi:hypothetical protein